MFESVKSIIKFPDIRKRVFFTIAIIVIFRLIAAIPIPGVDPESLNAAQDSNNLLFGLFTVLTGGQVDNISLVAIGIAPYITASVILQLLGTVIPKLEELQKEGDRGRQIMNQWTRYLTLPLALLQAYVVYTILRNPPIEIVRDLAGLELAGFLVSLTAGTLLLMWFGELITESGVGNGASLVITLGILASLPGLVVTDFKSFPIDTLILILIGIFILILIIVFFTEAQRKIQVQYARRVRGNKISGMQDSFLPLKINTAGVMPVIFASSLIVFPQMILQFLLSWVNSGTRIFDTLTTINKFYDAENRWIYSLVYFVLIIAFTFFYTFVAFKPKEVAENLKKSGGFIPGIRPGSATHEYLSSVMTRLAVVGSLFLATVALIPRLIRSSNVQITLLSGIGGTSILIVVSVILDMYRQIQAMRVTRSYDVYK